MKRYNPCHTSQGPVGLKECDKGMVVLHEDAVAIERTMKFWHARCRQLKSYLRRIEDEGINVADTGKDPWQALADITNLSVEALNGDGR